MNHIVILDIGKTNKKCFVFDEDYHIVLEQSTTLPETTDEAGYSCEDLHLLKDWVTKTIWDILDDRRFQVRAINCATYGASFVHIDAHDQPLTPLYNYLKPFPDDLKKQFFDQYGGEATLALETASPVLGHLNSGLQLYWLKHHKPLIFNQIKYALHLPQYISFLMESTAKQSTDLTSIGCHTMLWDFQQQDYHDWVKQEGITEKFPPMVKSAIPCAHQLNSAKHQKITVGTGLHDSSAALLPYLSTFKEPFLLLSTGTWCISLNPFNQEPLTAEELAQDCLCYLRVDGQPVKAARYFGGYAHEQAVKDLAATFGVSEDFYQTDELVSNPALAAAYTDFMQELVEKQAVSTRLALGRTTVRQIFVDGGFSKNKLYMTFLAQAFPDMEVHAAEVAQATALGAALVLHTCWNEKPVPDHLIQF